MYLISGQPEEAWESYDRTKEIVLDMILASLSSLQREEATRRVKTSGNNKLQMNWTDTKLAGPVLYLLLSIRKMTNRDYLKINEICLQESMSMRSFPVEIKRNRDTLRLILILAKTLPDYRDKSKLIEDRLIINGTAYTSPQFTSTPK